MVYPALLPLMRTPRLPVVDWTDAPADLYGLVHFARKTKSGFCACAITFQLASNTSVKNWHNTTICYSEFQQCNGTATERTFLLWSWQSCVGCGRFWIQNVPQAPAVLTPVIMFPLILPGKFWGTVCLWLRIRPGVLHSSSLPLRCSLCILSLDFTRCSLLTSFCHE